jgi:hypothetical protein
MCGDCQEPQRKAWPDLNCCKIAVGILLLREKRDQGGTNWCFSRQQAYNAYDHERFVSADLVIRPLLNRAHKEP